MEKREFQSDIKNRDTHLLLGKYSTSFGNPKKGSLPSHGKEPSKIVAEDEGVCASYCNVLIINIFYKATGTGLGHELFCAQRSMVFSVPGFNFFPDELTISADPVVRKIIYVRL
jgi:hypothetical protein